MSEVTALGMPQPGPRTIADIRPGHIVFCTRPSLMQRLNESVGDEWRHVGIAVETADGLFVAGFGRLAQYSLMPLASLATYERVGVASVFATAEQVELAQRWTLQFAEKKTLYPSSTVAMAGLLSYGRTQRSQLRRRAIVSTCVTYCRWLSRRYRDDIAFICSTFVASAINAASPDPIEFVLAEPKHGARRSAPRRTRDDLLARWLVTPSDLWRALPVASRSELVSVGSSNTTAAAGSRADGSSPSLVS